ncbi:MAG: type VI secretion system tip protein VgrG [Deltaproteobacteria bacterium]|nr:type VI secretion system tip protein VgrG [Deltaproteobacteria bacterium]
MSIQTRFYFQSRASSLGRDTFRVIRFHGEEEISQPFRFEIELVSDNADIDPDELLKWPAFLTIERGGKRRMVHGVLAEFEQQQETSLDLHFYRAVLVPRLWLLSMSRQNQIYQDKSVPEIVEEELKGSKDKGPAGLAAANLTTEDFELRLTRKYQKREYVVQYGESDLNFISRLMEHEGIFYFFEHDDEKEKIIITDDNIHFPAIAEESSIPYHSPSGMVIADEESVRAISCRHRRMPKKLILKDYNYRTPHVPLQGESDVDGKGHGLISEYGNHFKTPEEGMVLAKIRAEEIRCRHAVFGGEGDCSLFLPGHRYALQDHFRKDFNREYVITGVEHTGTQPVAGASGLGNDDREELTYRNAFTAIASDVPFRPERKTPKHRMYGIMNAHVDSALLKDRAEIDDQGRYKVVMPFDLSGSGEGKASRFVRMAQPYGGGSHGMHFPLHKDVEVIWACIDGDPDRPIIVGTVPNPLNPSVVTADNSTKNVIKTASGSFLEFNDGPGPGGMVQKTGGPQFQRQQQYQNNGNGTDSAILKCDAAAGSNREDVKEISQWKLGLGTVTDRYGAGCQGQLRRQQQMRSTGRYVQDTDPTVGIKIFTKGNYVVESNGHQKVILDDVRDPAPQFQLSNDTISEIETALTDLKTQQQEDHKGITQALGKVKYAPRMLTDADISSIINHLNSNNTYTDHADLTAKIKGTMGADYKYTGSALAGKVSNWSDKEDAVTRIILQHAENDNAWRRTVDIEGEQFYRTDGCHKIEAIKRVVNNKEIFEKIEMTDGGIIIDSGDDKDITLKCRKLNVINQLEDNTTFSDDLLYHYGDTKEYTYGEAYSEFHGKQTEYFYGAKEETHSGTLEEYFYGNKFAHTFASVEDIHEGHKLETFLGTRESFAAFQTLELYGGFKEEAALAGTFSLIIGITTAISIGMATEWHMLGKVSIAHGWKLEKDDTKIENSTALKILSFGIGCFA